VLGLAERHSVNQAQQAQAQAAANAASDDAQCRSYGAEPGSPSYIQCRMNLDNQRAQVAASDRAIALQTKLRGPSRDYLLGCLGVGLPSQGDSDTETNRNQVTTKYSRSPPFGLAF
jgi:hypothetical protein